MTPGSRFVPILALTSLAGCASARVRALPSEPQWAPQEPAPAPALAGVKADLRAAPRRLWDDLGVVASQSRNWLIMGGASAYALAQEHWEESEAQFFADHTLFSSTTQDILGALGNGLTLGLGTLAWYFTALARDDQRSYEASKTMFSSLTLTAVVTTVLKAAIPDGRPDGGTSDFPSGHASASMAAAATLDELYGHAWGVPAYGLATLIGLQRMDTGRHDSGSVVFGWALGFVIGHTVAAHHAPRIFGMDVGVLVDPETGGVGLALSGGL